MKERKRQLFDELMSGVSEMKEQREEKLTLKNYKIEPLQLPKISAKFIRETRDVLNMSQAVFANILQVNHRTLANWEQGRSKPNEQAVTLILLVRNFPDTLDRMRHLIAS